MVGNFPVRLIHTSSHSDFDTCCADLYHASLLEIDQINTRNWFLDKWDYHYLDDWHFLLMRGLNLITRAATMFLIFTQIACSAKNKPHVRTRQIFLSVPSLPTNSDVLPNHLEILFALFASWFSWQNKSFKATAFFSEIFNSHC